MTEFAVRVSFHGDADDVVVRVLATDETDASNRAYDWFEQDHNGPAVFEVEMLDRNGIPSEVWETAEFVPSK